MIYFLLKFDKKIFFSKLFFLSIILTSIGIIFIYSTEYNRSYNNYLFIKQSISFIIAIIAYYFISQINYNFYSNYTVLIYIAGLCLLFIVLIFGIRVNGAKSWVNLGFFNGQLSEFTKLAFILFFANFINRYQDYIYNASFFLFSLLLASPFLILLMMEPDFGSAIIFLCIFLIMFFAGGGNIKIFYLFVPISFISVIVPFGGFVIREIVAKDSFLLLFNLTFSQILFIAMILLILAGIILLIYYFFNSKILFIIFISVAILSISFFGACFFKFFMKEYHYERMLVTINPNLDPERKGYNLNQSLISIGGGRILGYGLTKGPQNAGAFLPSSHTDFILSVLAEEWGFLGVMFIVVLNVLLIYGILKIAHETKDQLGQLIAVGIGGLFISHFLINIMSVVGILPIIGNPLPFLSYGGSSLLTCFMAMGIIYNIKSFLYKPNKF